LASGGSTNWGSTANGPDTNALPGGNTNVLFAASGASNYTGTTLDGNFNINSLTFSNSGALGIAAGTPATSTLTIAGTGGSIAIAVNPGAGPATISAPVAIGASQTWSNNSSSSLTISGNIANDGNTLTLAGSGATTISGVIGGGSGGVVMAGSGLVVLAASNTYTGATTVSGGTLTLSGAGGAVNATSGVTVKQGATLLVDNRGGANNARISDAAGITLDGGTFTYLGKSVASTSETVGALTLGPGASTIAISGYGNNSSSTDNSTLTFGSGSTLSNCLLRTAMSGSMLDVTTAIPGQGGPGYTGYPNSGGDMVLFGGLAANGGPASINTPADWIIVNGHDIARWSGSHGIHEEGSQAITRYYNLGATSNPANANVLINGTAQTNLTANTTVGSLVVQSATAQTSTLTGYTLNIENNGSGSSNPLDNNGGIIVSGSGDFTPNGGYTINGGTITSGVSGKSSELFTWIDSGTTTIKSVIANIGGGATTLLVKAGSGTLVLDGANSYSAGTALDQGILNFATDTLPHTAANIHFYGGTLQWAAGNSQDISAGIAPTAGGETAILDTNGNNVNLATALSGGGGLAKLGGGVLSLLRANTYSGATTISAGTLQLGNGDVGNDGSIGGSSIIDDKTIVYDLSGSEAYSGAISGIGSLTKLGAGTLLLTGSNTYTGGTTIDVGTLCVTNADALPDGMSLTVGAGGTFIFDPTQASSSVAVSPGAAAVPEPSTLALLSVAVCGAAVYQSVRSRRKKNA
jgi:autotransporter-associated beta strand protein